MLSRIASVGSRAVKVTALAALLAAGAAGVTFYEGGRDRVGESFGPPVEKTKAFAARTWDKTSDYAERSWASAEENPTEFAPLLVAILTLVATFVYHRRKGRTSAEALVAVVTRGGIVAPVAGKGASDVVALVQNKNLATQLRAELSARKIRLVNLPGEIERAQRLLAKSTEARLEAEAILADAEKDEDKAQAALTKLVTERTNAESLVVSLSDEIARLEDRTA